MSTVDQDPRRAIHVLLELTRGLAERRSLEAALHEVTQALLALVPADHASVRLLDANSRDLLCGARAGVGIEHRPVRFSPGDGVLGWCVAHDEPLLVADATQDPRFEAILGQGFEVRSIMVEPLRAGGRVMGVLSASHARAGVFTEEDQLLCRLLANCSVPSIERARLERLALTDDTTLAFNVRYLFPRLEQELQRARERVSPLSVLLMDLDHFKTVNDTHSHAAGDKVLRDFADIVRGCVRRADVLVRRGGEEFLLIMPDATEDAAAATAERVRQRLSARPLALLGGHSHRQTVSIGVATWDGHEGADALERRADLAMYAAKHAGRDQVMVSGRHPQVPEPSGRSSLLP
jgi:diguanylate cyclase (GGDEF)-like protein